ncbi:MAG: GHKL domain-containing protein [Eubacterium sp.]
MSKTDIVSIIGNMCDNAIEYLIKIDKINRKCA